MTGTENVLTAAVLAEGTTIIRNAASEPHVQDLCRLLLAMGARIEGVGSNLLVVHGVRSLAGADVALGADFMEVGSFVALAAVTGGEIEIRHAGVEHMRMALMVFRRLGVEVRVRGDDLLVPGGQAPSVLPDLGNAIPRIDDGPWPAFPADLMSVALVTATQASGTVLFHEKMYESRLFFVDRLIGMGARVVLCDPHRALVHGPTRLRGEPQGLPSRQRSAFPDQALQAGAADVAHGEVEDAFDLVSVVDRDHIWMVEGSRELGLAQEPRAEVLVPRELGGEDFQCDLAPEALVGCEVDGAHPAAAEQRLNRVATERLADPGRQPFSHDRSAGGTRAGARSRSSPRP